jgi:hypothetical protein
MVSSNRKSIFGILCLPGAIYLSINLPTYLPIYVTLSLCLFVSLIHTYQDLRNCCIPGNVVKVVIQ